MLKTTKPIEELKKDITLVNLADDYCTSSELFEELYDEYIKLFNPSLGQIAILQRLLEFNFMLESANKKIRASKYTLNDVIMVHKTENKKYQNN